MGSNLDSAIAAMEAVNQNKNNIVNPIRQAYYPNGNAPAISIQRQRMEELSKMIKAERVKQGLTQKQLAGLSGYSQGTITRAETKCWISMYCLLSIFEALGKKIQLIDK